MTDDRDRRNTWYLVQTMLCTALVVSSDYRARELCDAAPGVSSTLRREDAKRLMMNYLSVHVNGFFLYV